MGCLVRVVTVTGLAIVMGDGKWHFYEVVRPCCNGLTFDNGSW